MYILIKHTISILCVIGIVFFTDSFPAQATGAPVSVELQAVGGWPSSDHFIVGEDIHFLITLTNTSGHPIRLLKSDAIQAGTMEYVVKIQDDAGNVPALTEYGQMIYAGEELSAPG